MSEPIESRWIAAAGLFFFGLAYRFYAKWLASKRIFDLDNSLKTPAHELADGVDYVPTNHHVLFGHHFTSIAGAAPIVGPAVAVIWGWLPALLWVVFGSILIGCVHDFGNLVISAKNRGRSLADLTGHLVGPTSRVLFLILVLLLTWIVLAVFAVIIGLLFVKNPETIIPVNIEIILAAVVGFVIYKLKKNLFWPSVTVLAILYGAIIFCSQENRDQWIPLNLRSCLTTAEAQTLKAERSQEISSKESDDLIQAVNQWHVPEATKRWVFLLLIYSAIASLLPVWFLLQPRDFINSHQLFVGLGLMYGAVLWVNPEVVAPAIHADPTGAAPLFPFLFITIACGAISGFHGLVASGTSSKQLNQMSDARLVGYGGMIGEASLALMATLACTAGFASREMWHNHYGDWNTANSLGSKVGAFVNGGGNFLNEILSCVMSEDISLTVAQAVVAVLVISFAATTLDSACRIQRFIIQEIGQATKIKILNQRLLATAVAAFTPLILVLGNSEGVPYWKKLWPIFGATNQLLGALALLMLTVYLARKKKIIWPTFLPMIYLMAITFSSLTIKTLQFAEQENTLLMIISTLLLLLALWIAFEGVRVLISHFKGSLKEDFKLR